MAQKYYLDEPEMTKTVWNANLNGACAVLALMYGEGNFQRTLDLSCAIGFDCDNQAATIAGLLGVVNGFKALPANLYLPIKGWEMPFNNKYVNITRYDMPEGKISEMIDQTLKLTIDLVVLKGGKLSGKQENEVLTINSQAVFNPPLEFYIGPLPVLEIGKRIDYDFYAEANKKYNWSLISGSLPEGLILKGGKLTGIPTKQGSSTITILLSNGKEQISHEFKLLVRGENIAIKADTILANVRQVNMAVLDSCWITFGKPMYAKNISVLNDGKTNGSGSVFYSLETKSNSPKIDYYGYGWKTPQEISMMALQTGCMEEFGGWFTSLNVQYQNEAGKWIPVEKISITPALPETDIVFFQPHFAEYVISFPTVVTRAIRIIGDTKIQDHWHKYTKHVSGFTSVTELSVYH